MNTAEHYDSNNSPEVLEISMRWSEHQVNCVHSSDEIVQVPGYTYACPQACWFEIFWVISIVAFTSEFNKIMISYLLFFTLVDAHIWGLAHTADQIIKVVVDQDHTLKYCKSKIKVFHC